jgi:hypothetical protein
VQQDLPLELPKAPASAPWIFSRLAPLKPSKVFDTYWRFAAARQEIFFRRYNGEPFPWTADAILRKFKFTNAYRASDRVSQYLINRVIYEGSQKPKEIFFRTILFKLFNRIETWELLRSSLGKLSVEGFEQRRYSKVLGAALGRGDKVYSAAYIMPPAMGFAGPRKHDTHLALLAKMLETDAFGRTFGAPSLKSAFVVLRSFAGIGDFLAYQFAIDLNYAACSSFDEYEFVVPGPGARDGIRKCFIDLGGLSEADVIRAVADRQEAEFARLGLVFRDLWGRRLHLIDCQNLFCEVDKYARLAHPEIVGITGRTRIKQQFRPTEQIPRYRFPTRWGLPAEVSAHVVAGNK